MYSSYLHHPKSREGGHRQHSGLNETNQIENLWPCILFKFNGSKLTVKPNTTRLSLKLDICKVQFAVTKNLNYTTMKLKEKKMKLKVQDRCIMITIDDLELNEHNVLSHVERVFEECITNDIKSKENEPLRTQDIFKKIKQYRPRSLQMGKSAAYYAEGSKNVYFVGDLNTLFKELHLGDELPPALPPRTTTEWKHATFAITEKMSILLKYLGFEADMKKKYPGIDIEVQRNPCQIQMYALATTGIEKETNRFFGAVSTASIQIKYPLCFKLLNDDNGTPNTHVYDYLSQELRKSNKKYENLRFFFWQENNSCLVYSVGDKQSSDAVVNVLKKFVVEDAVIKVSSANVWSCIESQKLNRKLVYEELSKDMVRVCCTKDVHFEVLSETQTIETAPCESKLYFSSWIINFLRSNEKETMSSFVKGEDMTVSFTSTEIILKRHSGVITEESLRKVQAKIRNLIRLVKVTVPEECLNQHELEHKMEVIKSDCLWHIRRNITPMETVSNCEYLSCWIDPIANMNVNVVKGFAWHINFDLHIVFINDYVIPIETDDYDPKAKTLFIETSLKTLENRKNNSLPLGDSTLPLKDIKNLGNSVTIGLVVKQDLRTDIQVTITEGQMKEGIHKVLRKFASKGVKTVGFSASVDDLDIVTHAIKGFQSCVKDSDTGIHDLFVCCDKNKEDVIDTVGRVFKNRCGILQKVSMVDSSSTLRKESTTKVTVEIMSIENSQVDAVVNTTNKSLNLSAGTVSKKILTKVGSSLEEDLKKKYKHGLKVNEVASTKVQKMANVPYHYIYHIALSEYRYSKFREEIKMYVQKCLCKAERDGCLSIAFPAFGVGNLQYPRRETAAAMFDAIYEYIDEAVDLKLRRVSIVAYKDDTDTCKAFLDEEWRRSKLCENETGVTNSLVKSDYEAYRMELYNGTLQIKVTTPERMGLPPPYAIQVSFGTGVVGYKSSARDAKTWNARYNCRPIKDKQGLRSSLEKCVSDLQKERTTMIVIYTTDDTSLSVGDQAACFVEFLRNHRLMNLTEVVIVVRDESGLVNASSQINAVAYKGKMPEPAVTIKVIGKTAERADDAEQYINSLMNKINEENLNRIYEQSCGAIQPGRLLRSDHVQENNINVTEILTAELNDGLVEYLEQTKQVDNWLLKINKTYGVTAERNTPRNTPRKLIVKGTLQSMLLFEQYLEERFPADPESLQTGIDDSSVTESEDSEDDRNELLSLKPVFV